MWDEVGEFRMKEDEIRNSLMIEPSVALIGSLVDVVHVGQSTRIQKIFLIHGFEIGWKLYFKGSIKNGDKSSHTNITTCLGTNVVTLLEK